MVERYPGKVRVVFKHYPLDGHPEARLAAQAAVAAGRQGRFWRMHDAIFEHPDALEREDLVGYARALELDTARFETDLDSEAVRVEVERDRAEAERYGVDGTPSFFVNGRRVTDSNSIEQLPNWIDDVLMR